MAEPMVVWAVRTSHDRVFDPSAGDAVFLHAALARLQQLGASEAAARGQLFGAEIDAGAHAAARAALILPTGQLACSDFFELAPGGPLPAVEALVGNPPYVRYQDFNAAGGRGHELASEAGVALPRRASSWAPFLVHGVSFVAPGGRMAQVLPAELLHARYAEQLLAFLLASFERVALVTFEERVFEGVLEEVVILLAEGRGGQAGQAEHHACQNLLDFSAEALRRPQPRPARPRHGGRGRQDKLLFSLLEPAAQQLYARLAEDTRVCALGELASVNIGVVTGNNRFFLRCDQQAQGLDGRLLRVAISKAAHIPGALVTPQDVQRLRENGASLLLLAARADAEPDALATLAPLLAQGEADGIDRAYKCRVARPGGLSRARSGPRRICC
jgi:adenine-specific DNA methylase